jgi:hypothetical protein
MAASFFLFCLDLISKYFFPDIYFWFFSSLPAGYPPNLLSSVSLSLSPGKLGFSRWQKMGEKLLEWTVSLIAAWDMYKYIYPFCRVDFVTNSTRRPLISNDGGTQQTHTNTHTHSYPRARRSLLRRRIDPGASRGQLTTRLFRCLPTGFFFSLFFLLLTRPVDCCRSNWCRSAWRRSFRYKPEEKKNKSHTEFSPSYFFFSVSLWLCIITQFARLL